MDIRDWALWISKILVVFTSLTAGLVCALEFILDNTNLIGWYGVVTGRWIIYDQRAGAYAALISVGALMLLIAVNGFIKSTTKVGGVQV